MTDEWEYGESWMEGDQRVYLRVGSKRAAEEAVAETSRGYPFPEENYVVRRHPATAWEPLSPDARDGESDAH